MLIQSSIVFLFCTSRTKQEKHLYGGHGSPGQSSWCSDYAMTWMVRGSIPGGTRVLSRLWKSRPAL